MDAERLRAKTLEAYRHKGGAGEYYYPVRVQTGIEPSTPQEIRTRKTHLKAEDNFGFMRDLEAFLLDK